jgi:hypothetical protein
MTMTLNTLKASLVAATLAIAPMTVPAEAGGSVSVSIVPQSQKDAQALRTGMQLYSLFNGIKGGASIKQLGINNIAGIGQNGGGNFGVVHQEGNGHAGTLQQNGNNNAYGIFQFGKNTNSNVVQNGNGDVGATFQFGW